MAKGIRGPRGAGTYDRVVGARIRALRESLELSMAQLAARVEPPTTDTQINKLEKGRVRMTIEWVYRLGNALGVHPLDLVEPIPKLTSREQALVDLYRGLNESDQHTVFRLADAMAQSADDVNNGEGAGA